MSIPQTFVQELLNRADIVDVVGRHVTLKKGGANYMGLCPFHGEKSPSFSVSPTKQFFHCFGCGKSGDAIAFLMEHTGATFVEAVHDLAGQFGLVVPQEQASAQDRARAAHIKAKQVTLTEVLERAAKAYQNELKLSDKAKNYFKGRGLSGDIAKAFGLGYAPEGWRSLAGVFPDYADALLVESGLVIENTDEQKSSDAAGRSAEVKRYDRFRDRVMFPIRNTKGECIGFGGRVLDNSLPKYLNSPETPVFSKGRELYGLYEARTAIRDKGYGLVTEGYMDVVALAQWGFGNSVATLGTACTSDHVQKLFRATDNVIFSFDGDKAGVRAAHKALVASLPLATDTRTVKFLFLPDEHDPDSFIREHGAQAFEKYVQSAKPLSRFLIEVASENCDLASAEGRAKMSSQAMSLWMPLPDGALKRQLASSIAEQVQIGQQELLNLWRVKNQSMPSRVPHKPALRTHAATTRTMPVSRADQALRLLLTDNTAWGTLTAEEHHLLCDLPAPHGEVFTWLDHQFMEYGAQNWAALSTALQDEPFAAFTVKQMRANTETGGEFNAEELRTILNAEQVERLKMEEQEVLQLFVKNPENKGLRERYEALKTKRLHLLKVTPLV
ncbi:MAG: DNA primase [Cytophagales bacterium]|nr:DNA primase [Cytophagales bacterium]